MTSTKRYAQAVDCAEIKAKELFGRGYPLPAAIKFGSSLAATIFRIESDDIEERVWAKARQSVFARARARALENG